MAVKVGFASAVSIAWKNLHDSPRYMLFNSFEFLVFLPTVFLLYWFVFNRNMRLQNLFLLIVSYIFYGWWDWRFLILLTLTSLSSWAAGLGIQFCQVRQRDKIARAILGFDVSLSLTILCFFKYFNFFVSSFITAFSTIGIPLHGPTLHIILPVGISFYTFQSIGYTIDVYRKKLPPTRDGIAFLAFVSFFPQLVAGPIERATNLLPQFFKPRVFDYDKAADGVRQIIWGFFKKLVIADNCAGYVHHAFSTCSSQSASTLLLVLFFTGLQVYCDFSGYSDIAIGTGRLFGFSLMRNFNYPFFSRNIAEFWQRWHISLTTWFRDYLYFPLGGSRGGKLKTIRNIFIVFAISGLWHGAKWPFVFLGLYYAVLFVPFVWMGWGKNQSRDVAAGRLLPNGKEFFQMLSTSLLMLFSAVFFLAGDMSHVVTFYKSLVTNPLWVPPLYEGFQPVLFALAVGITVLTVFEWLNRTRAFGLQFSSRVPRSIRWILSFFVLTLIGLYMNLAEIPFIYFQF